MLHIVETLTPYGGVPVKLLRLAERIAPSQGRLIFTVIEPAPLDEAMEKAGATVLPVGSASPMRMLMRLEQAIRQEAPDIICTHHTRGLLTGYVAAKRHCLPIVHHEHGGADYRQGIGRMAARIILPHVDRIICNSMYTQRSIASAYPGTTEKLCHVHDPVEERIARNDRSVSRQELGFGDEDTVVGHVGGLIKQRDQATLIRAVARLREARVRAKLLMVGDGPERERLGRLAEESGLAGHVLFTGYRDAGEVLGAMDIYVNPCVDEGFGIAVVEAMLAGLPVVIARAGSHPELIRDGQSGFLYEAGDPEALAERILRLTENPEEAARTGMQARLHAATHFTSARFVSEYLRALQPVLLGQAA